MLRIFYAAGIPTSAGTFIVALNFTADRIFVTCGVKQLLVCDWLSSTTADEEKFLLLANVFTEKQLFLKCD